MDFHSESSVEEWKHLHKIISSFPDHDPVLRMCCIDVLSGISYPHTDILELFINLSIDPRKEFALAALTMIMDDLVNGLKLKYFTYKFCGSTHLISIICIVFLQIE